MINNDFNAGNILMMKRTHPLHYGDRINGQGQGSSKAASFSEILLSSINKVNNLQVESDNLAQRMIYKPESVDIHTVRIIKSRMM